MLRAIAKLARNHIAQYIVVDDCGTFRPCYTLKGAESWLAYCGPRAAIMDKVSGSAIVSRRQVNA